jgi:hypothetical protein
MEDSLWCLAYANHNVLFDELVRHKVIMALVLDIVIEVKAGF